MKRLLLYICGLCSIIILIIPAVNTAQVAGPGAGAVGVGYDFVGAGLDSWEAGARGISVRYWASDQFAIQGVFGLMGFSPGEGDGATDFSFGGKFLYNSKSWAKANLHVGAGVGVYMRDMGDETATDIGIQALLGSEFFLVDNIGIETDVGFEIAIWDEMTLDGTSYRTNGDVLGNLTVHIYIPK